MDSVDNTKQNDIIADFSNIDSKEKAIELVEKGVLAPLYLLPLRFNGEDIDINILFVPPVVVKLKDRYDDMVEDLLVKGKVNGYVCTPEYKEKSFVPSKICIEAKKDGEVIFKETINIW